MRVVIICLLLIVLAFIGWRVAEQFDLLGPAPDVPAAEEEPAAEPTTEAPAEPAQAALPRFDIVRVDRSGDLTVAGRAAPNADIVLYANGEEFARTTAIENGDWIIFAEASLKAGPVELTLELTTPDGLTVRADETIVIFVPERDGDKPLVLRTTPGGATEVLQDPRDPSPALGPLSIDAIDYDATGTVIFSGRAEPGRIVQLFANRQPVGETAADGAGRWTMTAANIVPGVYTLLVVQLDENGNRAYAIEIPFKRERPEDIQIRDGAVVVQPGNSLWVIARSVYGSGFQYTIIYEANAAQIRDPDLIFPGQVFDLPEGTAPDDGGTGREEGPAE